MSGYTLRAARPEDIPAIAEIYNEAVLNTTATFDTEPVSLENRRAWFANRSADFPVAVAEEGGEIIGYAALNRWSERKAYDVTAELSLYIAPSHRGRGAGLALTAHMLALAKSSGLYTVLLRITADNAVSLKMPERFGFTRVGVLRRCGVKFGRVLDVVLFQQILK